MKEIKDEIKSGIKRDRSDAALSSGSDTPDNKRRMEFDTKRKPKPRDASQQVTHENIKNNAQLLLEMLKSTSGDSTANDAHNLVRMIDSTNLKMQQRGRKRWETLLSTDKVRQRIEQAYQSLATTSSEHTSSQPSHPDLHSTNTPSTGHPTETITPEVSTHGEPSIGQQDTQNFATKSLLDKSSTSQQDQLKLATKNLKAFNNDILNTFSNVLQKALEGEESTAYITRISALGLEACKILRSHTQQESTYQGKYTLLESITVLACIISRGKNGEKIMDHIKKRILPLTLHDLKGYAPQDLFDALQAERREHSSTKTPEVSTQHQVERGESSTAYHDTQEDSAMKSFLDKASLNSVITKKVLDTISKYGNSMTNSLVTTNGYRHLYTYINILSEYAMHNNYSHEKAVDSYKKLKEAYNDGTYNAALKRRCNLLGFPFAQSKQGSEPDDRESPAVPDRSQSIPNPDQVTLEKIRLLKQSLGTQRKSQAPESNEAIDFIERYEEALTRAKIYLQDKIKNPEYRGAFKALASLYDEGPTLDAYRAEGNFKILVDRMRQLLAHERIVIPAQEEEFGPDGGRLGEPSSSTQESPAVPDRSRSTSNPDQVTLDKLELVNTSLRMKKRNLELRQASKEPCLSENVQNFFDRCETEILRAKIYLQDKIKNPEYRGAFKALASLYDEGPTLDAYRAEGNFKILVDRMRQLLAHERIVIPAQEEEFGPDGGRLREPSSSTSVVASRRDALLSRQHQESPAVPDRSRSTSNPDQVTRDNIQLVKRSFHSMKRSHQPQSDETIDFYERYDNALIRAITYLQNKDPQNRGAFKTLANLYDEGPTLNAYRTEDNFKILVDRMRQLLAHERIVIPAQEEDGD